MPGERGKGDGFVMLSLVLAIYSKRSSGFLNERGNHKGCPYGRINGATLAHGQYR